MAVIGASDVRVHTSIPPLVPGEIKGTLHVRFPILKWDCATPPPAPRLNVLLKWWGESSEGSVFRVPIEYKDKLHPSIKPSLAIYNVQSNWKKFRAYLQDMGHLSLVAGLGRSADDMLAMGVCTVPHISDVTPGKLEKRTCAVVTEDGAVHLGRLTVELIVEMKDAVKLKRSQHRGVSGTTNHRGPSSSIVCSPLKGVEEDGSYDRPVNIVTLAANDKKWKPVKQVKFDSQKPRVLAEQQEEATPLPLSDKGKQLLCSIIEQAKTLHDNVITATTDTNHGRTANKEDIAMNDQGDNESHMDVPILPLGGVIEQEMTPPISPSESMMEIATALACVTEGGHQNVPGHDRSSIITSIPVMDLVKEPFKPLNDQLVNPSPVKHSQDNPSYGGNPPLRTLQIPRVPVVSGDWSAKEPELFHLLLEVSEGSGFSKSSDPAAQPSVYVQYRLFCLEMPIQTKVFHETKSPKINLKQIFPVFMDWNKLLSRLQRGYAVIEVWDNCYHDDAAATPPSSSIIKDELIGLVKISLYPFYAAVWCSLQKSSREQSLFPVVAVDGCCPVIDPMTGKTQGYLNVTLVMGTPTSLPAGVATISNNNEVPMADQSLPATTEDKAALTIDDDNYKHSSDTLEVSSDRTREEETDEDTTREEEGEEGAGNNPRPVDEVLHHPCNTTYSTNDQPDTAVNATVDTTSADTVQIDLLISQALHLPLLATPLGNTPRVLPSSYVTCHPHPSVSRISTGVCNNTQRPHWEHHCSTHIPKSLLEAPLSELEFQVWSLPPSTNNSTHKDDQQNMESHIFIGRAFIDLLPLQYGLRTIAGWYNLMDLSGELRGQIKIALTPKELIQPRREKQANSFYQSRSIIPTELEMYSLSNAPPTVINTSNINWCSEQGVDSQNKNEGDESLIVLWQQLQGHVADLEAVQDSLEAKLRETSQMFTRPHPSLHISMPPPPTQHIATPPHTQVPAMPPPNHIQLPATPTTCIQNSVIPPVQTYNPATPTHTRATPSPIQAHNPATPLSSPVTSCTPTITHSPLVGGAKEQDTPISITPSLVISTPTDIPFSSPSKQGDITGTNDTITLSPINRASTPIDDTVSTEMVSKRNIPPSSLKGAGLTTRHGDNVVAEEHLSEPHSLLKSPITTTDPPITAADPPFTAADPPYTATDPPLIATDPPITGTSPLNTASSPVPQQMSLLTSTGGTVRDVEEAVISHRTNDSHASTNQTSSSFNNPLTAMVTKEQSTVTEDSDGEVSVDINSSSELSVSIGHKITAGTVLDAIREDNSTDTITLDTSIIVETTPTMGHAHKPSLGVSDEELVEEEEVKRLFDRLLKEEHYSTSSSSSDTSTSNSSTLIVDQSQPLAVDDDHCSTTDESDNEDNEMKQSARQSTVADYRFNNNELAERLLSLRRSALSRRPPRPLPKVDERRRHIAN